MTRTEAFAKLSFLVEQAKAPAISDEDLGTILDASVRISNFAPGVAFAPRQLVIASTASLTTAGVAYIVTSGGVTGAEPVWPVMQGGSIISGGCTFAYFGYYDGCQWDLIAAKREGIRKHYQLAAQRINMQNRTVNVQDQQLFDHWSAVLSSLGPAVFVA